MEIMLIPVWNLPNIASQIPFTYFQSKDFPIQI